ncbi:MULTISPECIES: MBL fold metallo-hydrolase [Chryseobacterium]|uniref:Glyoxylase-like metal-dependent hydrolase (Beta-lactamase superfamily II) n=1 Tax=Chryseobacterium camelliae TaxID=1265445 RepID=A0ABU0TFP4_9FLAO|nr:MULTISPECIES: MBL fold metallo-hydrolase [Chryseobacterium]MDT3406314.1 glyoxylase-like metal-dependent hydrolase (beta-lactamase superfamily II) [Pseudacidovorax intermedius]MDQ1095887.1 glyoxylase-like metal-dependent hydrolase (beta-lactamase superfamily II) [Chryseobacterium camelliae]MDQ1099824.1 glyoxylase-like metal-dependent hydrolase (beta-lactamase superfamily II) [Chryseobacterium sp. SORGH_AS_1048]MDR6087170.1 glyoxylase-like metal-dependent hydrolase (beta-lactamase superfamily 
MSNLKIKVFNGGDTPGGFAVNSTLIYGEKDAILLDAQFAESSAHRLVAMITENGVKPSRVYISHFHPDHFLGLSVLKKTFPDIRVLSLPSIADDINSAFDFKIKYWGNTVLGLDGAKEKVLVEPWDKDHLELEGEKIEILGPLRGDSDDASALWIPSIKTLLAADTVFADAYVWIADAKTKQARKDWYDILDRLEKLQPEVVIPGHSPSNDPKYFHPDNIKFTRKYIRDFEETWREASDSQEIIDKMNAKYPNLAAKICLEMSAKILKDRFDWPGEYPPSLKDTVPEI